MLVSLVTILPVFAMILAGWVAARTGTLGAAATSELNRFVVYLALPAMLFGIMAKAQLSEVWDPAFVAAFAVGAMVVFGGVVFVAVRSGRSVVEAAIEGLGASYANTGFIGFPLMAALLGDSALAPTLVAAILTVTVLFGVALVVIELGASGGPGIGRALWNIALNPLLLAPALGAVVMLMGWPLPQPVDSFVTLLGAAASPCALVTLGLFLGSNSSRAKPGPVATMVGLKLVVQPALTWVVASPLLGLSHELVLIAVLLAALPTGTGPFMLAELHRQGQQQTAAVILVSTVASVVTLPLILAVLG